MSHEVESMAFAHETPWHGLGVRVSENMAPEEFLVKAGLDWTVEKRPLFLGRTDPETGLSTPIRVVCANTFAMSGGFESESTIRVPHTDHFEPEQAARQMELAREGMSEFEKNARLLQEGEQGSKMGEAIEKLEEALGSLEELDLDALAATLEEAAQ